MITEAKIRRDLDAGLGVHWRDVPAVLLASVVERGVFVVGPRGWLRRPGETSADRVRIRERMRQRRLRGDATADPQPFAKARNKAAAIVARLRHGPAKRSELAALVGCSERRVWHLLRSDEVGAELSGWGTTAVWSLPAGEAK